MPCPPGALLATTPVPQSSSSSPASSSQHRRRKTPLQQLMATAALALLLRPALATAGIRRSALAAALQGRAAAFVPAVGAASCRQYRLTPRCEAPRSPVPIPHDRLEFSFSRSSGPGGQNVNKLNTRVELRFEVAAAEWIPEAMRQRFQEQQRHRINKAGEFVVASQEHRTQLKNREDCLGKLEEALAQAAIVPKKRNMRKGLTEWEKENRLKEKKRRSETKSNRRQKHSFDD